MPKNLSKVRLIIGLLSFLILLASVTSALVLVRQRQETKTQAGQHDPPVCPDLQTLAITPGEVKTVTGRIRSPGEDVYIFIKNTGQYIEDWSGLMLWRIVENTCPVLTFNGGSCNQGDYFCDVSATITAPTTPGSCNFCIGFENDDGSCQWCYSMSVATPTLTPTPTPTATPTPTITPTIPITPTPTIDYRSCNETCNYQPNLICESGLVCNHSNLWSCRNPNCPDEIDCLCPTPTPTTPIPGELVCSTLLGAPNPPAYGDAVVLNCSGSPASVSQPIDHYDFQVKIDTGSWQNLGSSQNGTKSYTINQYGHYRFECRICTTSACTDWSE